MVDTIRRYFMGAPGPTSYLHIMLYRESSLCAHFTAQMNFTEDKNDSLNECTLHM